ncbi:S9 family peptidase, partial [Pseudomonadales bacterium]|nr:S9 family peptidase [Pseudomonadales bacterium]
VTVYGGPGVQRVTNEWIPPWHHYMASRGYALLQLDNRGSSNRGKAFEDPIFGRLGEVEVSDQLAGVNYATSLPWIDARRVGVFGHSYGGYMTLMLMMKAPQTFIAGVSVAPVTDWRLYDTHYTERYLGLPSQNPDGYLSSSVFPYVQNLRGKLLVIHGMADDNVLFTNSTKLYQALQDENIAFEIMNYPGAKHGLSGRKVNLHRYGMMDQFFDQHLTPTTAQALTNN